MKESNIVLWRKRSDLRLGTQEVESARKSEGNNHKGKRKVRLGAVSRARAEDTIVGAGPSNGESRHKEGISTDSRTKVKKGDKRTLFAARKYEVGATHICRHGGKN